MLVQAIALLSVMFHSVFFAVFWPDWHEKEIYKKYGKKVKGVVISSFNSKGPRMYYQFSAEGNVYRSFNVSNPDNFKAGDSILVLYNSNNPNMNERALEDK